MGRQEKWLAEGQVTSEPAMVHGELDDRVPAPPALIDEELADQLRFRPSESSSVERWRAARAARAPGRLPYLTARSCWWRARSHQSPRGGQMQSGPFRRAAVRGRARRDRQ